jgi:membrane-associated phospholipid phosphatase
LIVNGFEKVSLHGLGAGMFLAYIVSYYQLQVYYPLWIIFASTLLCGFILTSRLYLQKHSLKQVFLGFGIGFVVLYLTFHI